MIRPNDDDKAIAKAIIEMQLNNGTLEKLPNGYLAGFIAVYRQQARNEALEEACSLIFERGYQTWEGADEVLDAIRTLKNKGS